MEQSTKNTISLASIGCLGLLAVPLMFYFVILFAFLIFDLIPPGVNIGEIPVDWMTQEEAARVVDLEYNYRRTVLVEAESQSWLVPPVELGYYIDAQVLAQKARQEGVGLGAPLRIVFGLVGPRLYLQPEVLFSEQIARNQVDRWGLVLGYPASEARLTFSQGKWEIMLGEDGLVVDTNLTMRPVLADPQKTYWEQKLRLVTRPLPPSAGSAAGDLVKQRDQLNRPLLLRAYDPITDQEITGTIPASTLGQWVQLVSKNGSTTIQTDEAGFLQALKTWQSNLGAERELTSLPTGSTIARTWLEGQTLALNIRHKPTQYIVQPGDTLTGISMKVGIPYWKIIESNPGLNPDNVPAGQKLVIPSKNELLPLPVVRGKRIVISISQQRMWTYENGQQKKEYIVSTGIDRSPTMPGYFQVRTHDINAYASVWDLYMPNFLGIYEAWPGFMNGIHGLPTLSNGTRLWANVLGRKASYGCIILNLDAAREVYQWAENGVVVEIRP